MLLWKVTQGCIKLGPVGNSIACMPVSHRRFFLGRGGEEPGLPAVSETPLFVGDNEIEANLSEEAAQP